MNSVWILTGWVPVLCMVGIDKILNGVMATLFVLELSIYRLQEWTEKGIPMNQPCGSCMDILQSGNRAKSITSFVRGL